MIDPPSKYMVLWHRDPPGWVASHEGGGLNKVDLLSQDEAVDCALGWARQGAPSVVNVQSEEGVLEFSWEIQTDIEVRRDAAGGLDKVVFEHSGRLFSCSPGGDAIASVVAGGQARLSNATWDVHLDGASIGKIAADPDETEQTIRTDASRLAAELER